MLRLGEATFSNEMRIRVRGVPDESTDWPQTVTAAARQAMAKLDRRFPLAGALEIEIEFFLSRMQGMPGRAFAAAVPDLGRLTDTTVAALKDAGVWGGVADIVRCSSGKDKTLGSWPAGAAIYIRQLEPQDAWGKRRPLHGERDHGRLEACGIQA